MIRRPDGTQPPLDRSMSLTQWVEEGHELGFPSVEDLDYHLTTLFPPVRPRGWLELRMFDSLPAPWWRVPVAVATALEVAAWAARRTAGLWVEASRSGLEHPVLAASARSCFSAALAALGRLGAGSATVDAVSAYADRFVRRGRTPADEVLDLFHAAGGAWRPGQWMSAGRLQTV
ncbi:MAG: glutamate-cysteine ligase family protein [Acidimicrobiales bacterium]